jgi:hypothetical protein
MVQSSFEISRELRRQRGQRQTLLERLDEKDIARVKRNAVLEKQRRYYSPKANGRGRPAKNPKRPSQEDAARRAQYVAEIVLLDEAIAAAKEGRDAILHWLAMEQELGNDSAPRQRKIARLLAQFGDRKQSPPLLTVWDPDAIYAYLFAQRSRQQARVQAFKRLPVITLGEQDDEDRERAKLAVLERFCTSRHAESRERLASAAPMICADPDVPTQPPHDATLYRKAWREAVEELATDLTSRFAS